MSKMVLVLYVPALHRGYIELLNKYKDKAEALYVIDQDIIDQFPLAKREIRSIEPTTVQRLLRCFNADASIGVPIVRRNRSSDSSTSELSDAKSFPKVEIANEAKLKELAKDKGLTIVLSTEYISDFLKENYFKNHKVIREPVFLRYDEKTVKSARKEVKFSGTITEDEFHRTAMKQAIDMAQKSSDFFLQVGVSVIPRNHEPLFAYNIRMPSPHEMHIVGDPRNYLPYGTDTHQRTVLHAEQTLLAHCAKEGIKTEGADFYVTTFPCPDCCNIIAEAGIKKVYFKNGYSELSSGDIFKAYGIEVIKIS